MGDTIAIRGYQVSPSDSQSLQALPNYMQAATNAFEKFPNRVIPICNERFQEVGIRAIPGCNHRFQTAAKRYQAATKLQPTFPRIWEPGNTKLQPKHPRGWNPGDTMLQLTLQEFGNRATPTAANTDKLLQSAIKLQPTLPRIWEPATPSCNQR